MTPAASLGAWETGRFDYDGGEVIGRAVFSVDRRHRYCLIRRWAWGLDTLTWIMLNPSVAGAATDDSTIRKCVGYAKRNGYGGIRVLNLFALVSTDPTILPEIEDAVGPLNDVLIRDWLTPAVASAPPAAVVAAWGAAGALRERPAAVCTIMDDVGVEPLCLGVTANGQPLHPGRTPYDLPLHPWRPSFG